MEEKKMNLLLVGLVILLVVVAGVQTLQIRALGEKITSGDIKTGSAVASQTTQATTAAPSAAPTMVGGC